MLDALTKYTKGPGNVLQVLKQKRLYESQRDQIYNQQFNVEQTSFVMENVQDSVQTVQAMKAAGGANFEARLCLHCSQCIHS